MLNRIRYFQSVVRNNSFTQAAEECHISQSAISQHVKSLEKELGVQLLIRHNRSFSLTEAGACFYKKSLVLVADYDRMVQETLRAARPDTAVLRIGYLRSYGSTQIQNAVASFSEAYPDVKIEVTGGNHEDLYDLLRMGKIDIVLNDQRRAFSDVYVNCSLAYQDTFAEIAARNPMADLARVEVNELKSTPCILVASQEQQETERTYYSTVVGIVSDILFAPSQDEARLMAVQNNGFMLADQGAPVYGHTTRRIPLYRGENRIRTHYCAFWKASSSDPYLEEFAKLLKDEFVN